MEGSSQGLTVVLSQHLPGQTKENHKKNLSQYSQCPGQNSNHAPPKYKSTECYHKTNLFGPEHQPTALSLCQPAQCEGQGWINSCFSSVDEWKCYFCVLLLIWQWI